MSNTNSTGSKIWNTVKNVAGIIPGVGSAISAGLSLFDSIFGKSDEEVYKDKLSQDIKYQKEMLDYTNTQNLATSQLAQQYNWKTYDSPLAKMKAYQEAGINPNLVTGQNYQLSGITTSASAGSAPSGYTDTRAAKIAQKIQMSSLFQDMEVKQAAINYQNEQANLVKEEARGIALDNQKKLAEKPYWEQNAYEQAMSYILGNFSTEAGISLAEAQAKKALSDVDLNEIVGQKHATEIGNLLCQRNFIAASIEEKYQMIKKIDQDITVGKATVLMLKSQAEYNSVMSQLAPYQQREIEARISKCNSESDLNQTLNAQSLYDLGIKQQYGEVDKIIEMAGKIVGTAATAYNAYSSTPTSNTDAVMDKVTTTYDGNGNITKKQRTFSRKRR